MNITLTVAVATCHPEMFYESMHDLARMTHGHVDLIVFGNGCQIDAARIPAPIRVVAVDSVETNRGIPFALHRLWQLAASSYHGLPAEGHVVAYMHDDLFMREDGWNIRVATAFAEDDAIQLAGVLGSPGLGRDEIYRDPYEFWHLSRVIATWSNLGNAEAHGERVSDNRDVCFVDGVAMFVRRSMLDAIGGWSWWPENLVHHAYDYGIACMVRRHHGRVKLVPLRAKHGVGMSEAEHGGGHAGTTGTAPYTSLVEGLGGDHAVHRASHAWVYEHFRDVLPLRMP